MNDASTATRRLAAAGLSGRRAGLGTGLLLGALALAAWQCCARTHARRRAQRPQAAPAAVQDWENEGGAPDPCPG